MSGPLTAPTPTVTPSDSTSSSATASTSENFDTIALTAAPSPSGSIYKPGSNFLQPVITAVPTPCNEVIFQVSTTLVVKYGAYYRDIPVESFQPQYRALADGSLISTPFAEDLLSAHLTLLIIGCLAAVFLRNVWVSFDYVRRGKVKKKVLFHVLLASQLLGPLSLLPIVVSYFVERINCSAVVTISYIAATTSLGLLITGILGTKAYKCLENPRFLLILLALIQMASTAFVILDVIATRGARRLTGSCVQVGNLNFTRIFVTIQFAESLLICLCFVYACYKSRGSPASRGRMSVRLSLDDLPIQMPPDEDGGNPQSRGWWDHIPNGRPADAELKDEPEEVTQEKPSTSESGIQRVIKAVPTQVVRLLGTREQRRRYSPYGQESKEQGSSSRANEFLDAPHAHFGGRHSPALSAGSRFSRLIPRMTLFRKVVKDELLYTTFITSTCVIVAVFALIGLHFRTALSVTGWIALNWAIISLLTVHSFGRVVHRHEREAWIQQSASSRPMRIGTTYSHNNNSRRTVAQTRTPSVFTARSTTRSRSISKPYRAGDPNDPYSDSRPLDQDKLSWQFGTIEPSPPRPTRSPLMLSVRNVTPNSTVTQEFEFERASTPPPPTMQRNVSWQSAVPNRI